MKRLSISVALALHMILSSASAAEPSHLTFGIYPYDSPTKIHKDFGPLMKRLSEEVGIPFKIVIVPNYMSFIKSIGEGKIDIGFMGPSPYVKVKDKYGSVELAARLLFRGNKNDKMVIISYTGSKIRTLGDIRGKTFAFGDFQSYGSHFYPRYLLNKAGVTLRDLKAYDYLSSHSRVVLAVSHRDFDAGGVRMDIYEKYKDRPINMIAGPFKIPPHVIVYRQGLTEEIKKKIKETLLKMTDRDILDSIDPDLMKFTSVRDKDFIEARRVLDYIENR